MSVDGKSEWLENKAVELFEEMQRKNPHLSWIEIDELCHEQAEKDYMNQPEVDYKKINEESAIGDSPVTEEDIDRLPEEICLYPDSLSAEEE